MVHWYAKNVARQQGDEQSSTTMLTWWSISWEVGGSSLRLLGLPLSRRPGLHGDSVDLGHEVLERLVHQTVPIQQRLTLELLGHDDQVELGAAPIREVVCLLMTIIRRNGGVSWSVA